VAGGPTPPRAGGTVGGWPPASAAGTATMSATSTAADGYRKFSPPEGSKLPAPVDGKHKP